MQRNMVGTCIVSPPCASPLPTEPSTPGVVFNKHCTEMYLLNKNADN